MFFCARVLTAVALAQLLWARASALHYGAEKDALGGICTSVFSFHETFRCTDCSSELYGNRTVVKMLYVENQADLCSGAKLKAYVTETPFAVAVRDYYTVTCPWQDINDAVYENGGIAVVRFATFSEGGYMAFFRAVSVGLTPQKKNQTVDWFDVGVKDSGPLKEIARKQGYAWISGLDDGDAQNLWLKVYTGKGCFALRIVWPFLFGICALMAVRNFIYFYKKLGNFQFVPTLIVPIIEFVANAERATYWAVDPLYSTGALPVDVNRRLMTISGPLNLATTIIMAFFYAQMYSAIRNFRGISAFMERRSTRLAFGVLYIGLTVVDFLLSNEILSGIFYAGTHLIAGIAYLWFGVKAMDIAVRTSSYHSASNLETTRSQRFKQSGALKPIITCMFAASAFMFLFVLTTICFATPLYGHTWFHMPIWYTTNLSTFGMSFFKLKSFFKAKQSTSYVTPTTAASSMVGTGTMGETEVTSEVPAEAVMEA